MTFDEAIKKVNQSNSAESIIIPKYLLVEYIEQLREEYAPTIEMTNVQKDTIISLLDNSDISKDDWDKMITDDSPELPEMSYRQAIMAYMNPETMKVVDE